MQEDPRKDILRQKLRELITEQSEGEWSIETVEEDVKKFTDALWNLCA